jgi:hypothetical protein
VILKDNNMLIEVKAKLRLGDTLVPLIFMSDRTCLSNFAGDNKQWAEYMTIRNQSSKIPHILSVHTVVMFALLPIPIKNHNTPQKQLDEKSETNAEVLHEVLRRVL